MKRVLKDFGALTPAEAKLRDEVGSGLGVLIGDGTLPDADVGPERQIRAGFIRYLALGGCDKCRPSEKGVRVAGAVIVSNGPQDSAARGSTRGLDLERCRIVGDLVLCNCRFTDAPLLLGAEVGSLFLNGSSLDRGLDADRLNSMGGIFLRDIKAKGAVRLLGASLGGDLDCSAARFEAAEVRSGQMGHAFSADGLTAKGNVFLSDVTAKGAVRLLGASLSGDLSCRGADFSECGLILQSARVGGGLLLSALDSRPAVLDLTDAQVGTLLDERNSWPEKGGLYVDRFRYGAILGADAPLDASARLDWLSRMSGDPAIGAFSPQPYEQLAKVLREMGHRSDARAVLVKKEELQRQASRARMQGGYRLLRTAVDFVLHWTVWYGYHPLRAGWWLLALWLFGAVVYSDANITGDLKPNNAFVLRADEWVNCADRGAFADQLRCFEAQPEAASYPAFNHLTYSLDVLLPVVSLEMQQYWIPDPSKSTRGILTRWFLWLQILAGWALTLLAVAGFSGIVKSDR